MSGTECGQRERICERKAASVHSTSRPVLAKDGKVPTVGRHQHLGPAGSGHAPAREPSPSEPSHNCRKVQNFL